jgi:hypothetical protein
LKCHERLLHDPRTVTNDSLDAHQHKTDADNIADNITEDISD